MTTARATAQAIADTAATLRGLIAALREHEHQGGELEVEILRSQETRIEHIEWAAKNLVEALKNPEEG